MPRSSSSSNPRSSSRSFHAPSNQSVMPFRNPYSAVAPQPPTTGQMLKESIVSGVGSGVGFSLGSRLVSGLFGAPTVNVASSTNPAALPSATAVPSAPAQLPAFQQCTQNAFDAGEKLLCVRLYNTDASYAEFKQCMETSDNQIHACKEFLPKKD